MRNKLLEVDNFIPPQSPKKEHKFPVLEHFYAFQGEFHGLRPTHPLNVIDFYQCAEQACVARLKH